MNKVKEFKAILELLYNVTNEKEYAIEILKALETEEEILAMKELLEQFPEIVLSEIYDALHEISKGRFKKEFAKARYLKQAYLYKPDAESLAKLLEQLQEDGVYSLVEWNLTDEELEKMENAEVGDTVHIKTKVNPALFTSEDGETIFAYLYTSEIEIPKVRYSEYAVQQTSMNYILALVKSIKDAAGKRVALLLDYDSDDNIVVTDDMLL